MPLDDPAGIVAYFGKVSSDDQDHTAPQATERRLTQPGVPHPDRGGLTP
jgi:hypothetical protein